MMLLISISHFSLNNSAENVRKATTIIKIETVEVKNKDMLHIHISSS